MLYCPTVSAALPLLFGCFCYTQKVSLLLALSSLSSLLLLGALLVLVLARADGSAWVQADLVRDLACRTSCSNCSSASCQALSCVRKHCSLVLQNQGFLWPARMPIHRCFLPLSLSLIHLLLLSLLLGREGGGEDVGRRSGGLSSLVTCSSDPNNFIYTNPAPTGSKTILKLTAVTSQGKNYIYAGCYREGTVIAYNCTQVQQLQATITQLQQDLESTSKETSVAKEAKRAQEDAVR